ncbi:MAG: hypothetical protein ACXABY_21635 [Candidatus Thorarchaeota archaeon]|jgi:hypothetical protein
MESVREELASEGLTPSKVVLFILYAVALAMGVAVMVLPWVGQPVDQSLIGIAIFCLAVAGLNHVQEKK